MANTRDVFEKRHGGGFIFVIPGVAFSSDNVRVDFKDGHWVLTYPDSDRVYEGRGENQTTAYLDLIADRAGLKE